MVRANMFMWLMRLPLAVQARWPLRLCMSIVKVLTANGAFLIYKTDSGTSKLPIYQQKHLKQSVITVTF